MKRFLSIIIKALVIIVLVLTIVLIAVIKKNPEAAEAMTRCLFNRTSGYCHCDSEHRSYRFSH